MKILFIPGLAQNLSDQNYRDFFLLLQEGGHTVVGWKPDWNTLNFDEGQKIIQDFVPDCIIGFSLGAVCAFQLAQKAKCKYVVLCSLAPFALGSNISDGGAVRVGIFLGQEENVYIRQMSVEAAAFYQEKGIKAEVSSVSGAQHEMGAAYQKKVFEWLACL